MPDAHQNAANETPRASTVAWSADGHAIRIIDQTLLPEREVVLELYELDSVIEAIRMLRVRGAPAIGVAAAMGIVVALSHASNGDHSVARGSLGQFADRLVASRPTAVNLAWAINRVVRVANAASDSTMLDAMRQEAQAIHDEDVAMCARIGEAGLHLIRDGARVLTHCNAGALATAGIGTALAPLYLAHNAGRQFKVFADETRPLRQGARLTAWELSRAGIDVTVLPDSAAASLLRSGNIDVVIVGADRIARNGDVANKVGTYSVALAARAHNVPLYVAAPISTFDFETESGEHIEIEQRAPAELHPLPAHVGVYNPAFDVTPHSLIAGYITDRGLLQLPFDADALRSSRP